MTSPSPADGSMSAAELNNSERNLKTVQRELEARREKLVSELRWIDQAMDIVWHLQGVIETETEKLDAVGSES